MSNPFRRRRRANQSARYLNKREAQEWRGAYDRAGNRTYIRFDYDPGTHRRVDKERD
jgi:hypothetical protein